MLSVYHQKHYGSLHFLKHIEYFWPSLMISSGWLTQSPIRPPRLGHWRVKLCCVCSPPDKAVVKVQGFVWQNSVCMDVSDRNLQPWIRIQIANPNSKRCVYVGVFVWVCLWGGSLPERPHGGHRRLPGWKHTPTPADRNSGNKNVSMWSRNTATFDINDVLVCQSLGNTPPPLPSSETNKNIVVLT